jgi:hypothetical protein
LQVSLLAHNSTNTIRIITDNVRAEKVYTENDDSSVFFNTRSGEDTLRYIRGRGLTDIPVLVFTFGSIPLTRYVEEFALAGSTIKNQVVRVYIKGLTGEGNDSALWKGFNR